MGLLQTILHDVQSAGHALSGGGTPQAAPQQPMQLPVHAAAGGGIGAALAANPGLMKHLLSVVAPHLAADANASPQSGFGQQVQNVGSAPIQLQAGNTYWQNTDGASRNMLNPQVNDNGFYYN